jgi:hypothetical protein
MTRVMRSTVVEARGGCDRCPVQWSGKNALALAARHHDKTRHPTWAEQTQRTHYGEAGTRRGAGAEARLL